MIPSHPSVNDQGTKVSRPLYNIKEEDFSKLEPTSLLKQTIDTNSSLLTPLKAPKSYGTYTKQNQEDVIALIKEGGNGLRTHQHVNNHTNKASKPLVDIKEEEGTKVESSSLLTQTIENNTSLLTPLKAPKSYGTYSKQQQEDVIAFIKDGNSLRTAEKVFGIPKSTMHCWLKKIHNNTDTLSSTAVEQFSDLNIDTQYPFNSNNNNNNSSSNNNSNNNNNNNNHSSNNNNNHSEDYSGSNKVKSCKDNHNHQRKTSPSSQIVIEESELIRFLQSNEGMEMIAKAYCVTVHDFLDFIHNSKSKTQDNLKSLLASTGQTRPVEVIGLFPQRKTSDGKESTKENQPVSPNTVRKRNLQSDLNADKTCPPVAVLQKKIKVEQNIYDLKEDANNNILTNNNNSSNHNHVAIGNNQINNNNNNRNSSSSILASLLTKGSYKAETDWKPVMPTKLVLTTKQYLAASKIISAAQPNLVNTFLSPKPLAMTLDMTNPRQQPITQQANTLLNCNNQNSNNHLLDPTSELTLGYPKITNPVSIKAERLDSEITLPCDVPPNSGPIDCIRTFTPVVHSITRPTVTSNNTATLNLNEINRTQSERELMAMVDGDNVSADELCAEFKETLELSNWVDNETWYMDQYLQHFQVSPAITSPGSSLPDADLDDLDEGDNSGLTFIVDKEKDKEIKICTTDMEKLIIYVLLQ